MGDNQNSGKKAYAATFSLRLDHIAKISDLEQITGKNKSQVVQEAIERYYDAMLHKFNAAAPQP